jgi:immune inhibitor A
MGQGQRRFRLAPLLLVLAIMLGGCDGSFWASSPHPQPIGPGCPAWTAPTNPPTIAPTTATDPAAIAASNAQIINQTQRPVRDLYTLTQRLINHQPGHIACQATKAPPDEQVGAEQQFWVINPSQSGYHQISARLDYVTPHLYVYVQDGATVNYLALKQSADRFEAQTYDRDRAAFGDQWNLGPDHQARITLLNATNLGPVGGYFSSEDEYPAAINPYSNARQMIYLNLTGGATPGSAYYDATLAHEFQHMIHWWARPGDPSWVNEGMSVLAQRLNGLPTDGLERAYFNAPQTPLVNGWTDDARTNLPRYGAGFTFMDYFYERYGGDAALRALMASNAQVPQAFDQALARLHSHDRFDDVYAKFLAANLLNDPTIAGGAYSYQAFPGERAHVSTVTRYPYTLTTGSLAQYGAAYYDFRAPASIGDTPLTLNLDFSGAPMTTAIPNTPYGADQTEWWSNSGDNMDSTLTRTVDLTSVTTGPIQMTFDAWYNLESGFDYTYVEASVDGGATWAALPTTTATTANPNGENDGDGMTGVSGGGSQPQWTPETVDLSAYAGTKLRLRFETVTDDAVHNAGFALDSLSIPAINYTSEAPTDSGWTANGWTRTNNTLPQQWLVQAVVYHPGGKAPSIQPVAVEAMTEQASATFLSFGGDISHVTLIVSPMAPTTYTVAPYQLTVSVN